MNTALEPPSKRIDTTTSRTAEMTCLSRAASSFETEWHYHCDDSIAAKMIPAGLVPFLHTRIGRAIFRRCAKTGMYEYVIARTKYIDAAFEQAMEDGFDEIVILGAGFDSRALRFNTTLQRTHVYELDVPITQAAKINRYRRRGLTIPSNLTFVAIDFDKESIAAKLAASGFQGGERTLFILEGVLMYLLPASVETTFQTLETLAGRGSRVVFDYVRASVLRGENTLYGEEGASQSVSRVQEKWVFGIEPVEVSGFVAKHGFAVSDHADASELERRYFTGENGAALARVNGTHGIVTAGRI
jgi:methyltransferase (TIGR00027 family)